MTQVNILIVEDNPEDRELYKRYLRSNQNLQVLEAEIGEEALDMLDSHSVSLVLVDYNLPDMDGIEIIRAIRQHEKGEYVPIIMLTGLGNEEIAVEALKLGAQDYLIKGKLSATALLRSIENALKQTKLEQQLRDKTRELEDFVSVAAHDLKSPLSTIYVYCQMLKEQLGEQQETSELVQVIEKRSEQMIHLIDTLLSYTRLGRITTDLYPVELNDIIDCVKQNLHNLIVERDCEILCDNLPGVIGEETGLIQIFQNILSNSIKYCRQKPRIRLSAQQSDKLAIIAIQDNGIGIKKSEFDNIFLPFTRLHKGSEFIGTGIGLANVKKIVEQFHGKIWIESVVDQGSTFYISLPLRDTLKDLSKSA